MNIARTAEIISNAPTVTRLFGELLERDGIAS
jgi:hypothetical protein